MSWTWTRSSRAADEVGCACTLTHECLCAPEGLEAIKGAVSENELDGILVAACSERAKTTEFASLTEDGPSMFRVALREHCTWPLKDVEDDEDRTMLGQDMVRMGLARLDGFKVIEKLDEEISDTVMVVGSGRAGLEAALTAAGLGHPVVIVEKDDKLGGLLAEQVSIVPEEPPYEHPKPIRFPSSSRRSRPTTRSRSSRPPTSSQSTANPASSRSNSTALRASK